MLTGEDAHNERLFAASSWNQEDPECDECGGEINEDGDCMDCGKTYMSAAERREEAQVAKAEAYANAREDREWA